MRRRTAPARPRAATVAATVAAAFAVAVATAIAATIAVAATGPAPAAAKGIAALALYGSRGCHAVDAAAVRAGFESFRPATSPRRAEPFFTVRARARVSSGTVAEVYALDWLPRDR